ncbi:hypothetical protein [Allohahella sp. A8]|uniref:hypothetical protein n=1 Tax=Allohahella sp. A8 TaxID=3141461 RepID=UPI003A80E8DE
MSEKYVRFSCVFDQDASAKRFADSLHPLNEDLGAEFDARMKELGVRPVIKKFAESCVIEHTAITNNFVEINFQTSYEDKFPSTFVKDLAALGAYLTVTTTDSDYGSSTSFFYNGVKTKKKDLESVLSALPAEQAFVMSFAMGEAEIKRQLKAIGGPGTKVMGVPAFFYLPQYVEDETLTGCLKQVDINSVSSVTGGNALHYLLSKPDFEDRVSLQALLEAGINVNHADHRGQTPLIVACKIFGWAEFLLAVEGIDTRARDNQDMEAIHHLCFHKLGKSEAENLVDLFKKNNADLDASSPHGSPAWIAAKHSPNLFMALSSAGARPVAPAGAYGDDIFSRLMTAAEHQDEHSLATDLAHLAEEALSHEQMIELFKAACKQRSSAIFRTLAKHSRFAPKAFSAEGGSLYQLLDLNEQYEYRIDEAVDIAIQLVANEDPNVLQENVGNLDVNTFLRRAGNRAILLLEKLNALGISFQRFVLHCQVLETRKDQISKREFLEELLPYRFDMTSCIKDREARWTYQITQDDIGLALALLEHSKEVPSWSLLGATWQQSLKSHQFTEFLAYLESIDLKQLRTQATPVHDFDKNTVSYLWRKLLEASTSLDDGELSNLFAQLSQLAPASNLKQELEWMIEWPVFSAPEKLRLSNAVNMSITA